MAIFGSTSSAFKTKQNNFDEEAAENAASFILAFLGRAFIVLATLVL